MLSAAGCEHACWPSARQRQTDGTWLGGKGRRDLRRQVAVAACRNLPLQIKDLDRGLVDFPSFRQNREVFLCWEEGETDIEFWHDLSAGYGGRERL